MEKALTVRPVHVVPTGFAQCAAGDASAWEVYDESDPDDPVLLASLPSHEAARQRFPGVVLVDY